MLDILNELKLDQPVKDKLLKVCSTLERLGYRYRNYGTSEFKFTTILYDKFVSKIQVNDYEKEWLKLGALLKRWGFRETRILLERGLEYTAYFDNENQIRLTYSERIFSDPAILIDVTVFKQSQVLREAE